MRSLPFDLAGPIARLPRQGLITTDDRQALVSRDDGRTWSARPMFEYSRRSKEYKFADERILLRTREGVLVFAFINLNETRWLWRDELHDTLPGTRSAMYVVRSTDDGRTWRDLQLLHEDWTGDLRCGIQTQEGRIALSSMKMLHQPGRHGVLTYSSDDQGISWRASNLIDLGGCGHHAGAIEAPIVERGDGSILMLIRTNWGVFWQAESYDGGLSWRTIGPTTLDASSAPGQLLRLGSGRILLAWNRRAPQRSRGEVEMRGGDGIWSEVRASNHREELSLAWSDDDGRTWSPPIVAARQRGVWLSYPRLLERRRGEVWLTTMQGGVRVAFREQDLLTV